MKKAESLGLYVIVPLTGKDLSRVPLNVCRGDEVVYPFKNNFGFQHGGQHLARKWCGTLGKHILPRCQKLFAKDWGFLPAFPAPDCYTQEQFLWSELTVLID